MKNKSKISWIEYVIIIGCLLLCLVTVTLILGNWDKHNPPPGVASATYKPVMTVTATLAPTLTKTVKPTNTATVIVVPTYTATIVVKTNTPVPTIMPTPTRTLIPQKGVGGKIVKEGDTSKR